MQRDVVLVARQLSLGGYLNSRRPIGLVLDLLRSDEPSVSSIVAIFGAIETDLACLSPNTKQLIYGVVSLGVFGLPPVIRSAAGNGKLELVEMGSTALVRALQAGARAEPYALTRATPPAVALWKRSVGALGGFSHIPPIRPSDAYIHVPYANPDTGIAWGYGVGPDLVLAAASERTTVSYDVAVPAPPRAANLFQIPAHLIADLQHRPFGSFPSMCWPLYAPYPQWCAAYVREMRKPNDGNYADSIRKLGLVEQHHDLVSNSITAADVPFLLFQDGAYPDAVVRHRKELAKWLTG